ADQIENHVPYVFAAMYAPAVEDRDDHGAKFLERVLPDAIEQLRPGHMAHAHSLDFLLLLGRKVECIAQKDVPVPVIAGVVGHKRLESLGESNFLHRQKRRVSNALPKIIGNRKRATVESLSAMNKQTSGSRNGYFSSSSSENTPVRQRRGERRREGNVR